MSTRAIIARPTEQGWEGVYHHSDGYPSWLGKRLYELVTGEYAGDAAAAARYLIDEHRAGWSALGNPYPASEGEAFYTQADTAEAWDIEWTYILAPDALLVFAGCSEMRPCGRLLWNVAPTESDWTRAECGEHFEHCTHYAWVHFEGAPDVGTAEYLKAQAGA